MQDIRFLPKGISAAFSSHPLSIQVLCISTPDSDTNTAALLSEGRVETKTDIQREEVSEHL